MLRKLQKFLILRVIKSKQGALLLFFNQACVCPLQPLSFLLFLRGIFRRAVHLVFLFFCFIYKKYDKLALQPKESLVWPIDIIFLKKKIVVDLSE